jgi:hypothetical protein
VTITPGGIFTYDPALTYLDGRGTSTLKLLGVPVTVDPTRLSQPSWGFAGGGWLPTSTVHNLRMLPGDYVIIVWDHNLLGKVTITPGGTFDYDPTLTHLTGRGTNLLIIS